MTNLINFLAIFSRWLFDFLILFLFLRVILSWFPMRPNRFTFFLRNITNPLLLFFQRLPFSRVGMIDLSPILAYFALLLLDTLLRNLFLKLGANPGIYFV